MVRWVVTKINKNKNGYNLYLIEKRSILEYRHRKNDSNNGSS